MKNIIKITVVFIILLSLVLLNKKQEKNTKEITVAEVTHSIFYAPWYVALENNYFDDLKVNVVLTSGANNVVSAVLSKDVEIGLCGPEATMYIEENNNQNKIKSFASLTKKDGQFLVLRNNIKYNNLKDIEGLTILGGRTGGMPLLNFQTALKNNNINNVNIDTTIEFANLSSAFISNIGDGVNLFEPNATTLVKQGYGYIATNIGTYANEVPYTTFNARTEYIEKNKDIIIKFYKGIEKGLDYVHNHTSEEIANIIKKQFTNIEYEDLIIMIDNYKKYDSWYATPKIPKEALNNLEEMLIDNNNLKEKIPYEELVYEFN